MHSVNMSHNGISTAVTTYTWKFSWIWNVEPFSLFSQHFTTLILTAN